MEANKKVGVLFSGGLDSTFLVWNNLKKGNEVYPFYIEIKNNRDKPILEKNRVQLLFEMFYKEYSDLIRCPKYILNVDVTDNNSELHLQQVPVWILGLLFSQVHGLDEIQIGYVMNDDAISYISDIKKIYNSYNRISEPLIPISFPLKKWKKEMIIQELPMKYRELTVTCEEPTIIGNRNNVVGIGEETKPLEYRACGRCVACQRIIANRYYEEIPESYKGVEIEKSMNTLMRLGKKIDEKREDNRYYITVELPDESPLKAEPHQLHIPFDQEEKYEKENG
jgi:7-cyano-7-deazaguanine synthase in queuosine biosynthesis